MIWNIYWQNSHNPVAKLSPYVLLISGVLSILLTVFAGIDTSRFFKPRVLFLLISLTLFELPIYLFTRASEFTKILIFYILIWCIFLSPILLFITEAVVIIKQKITKREILVFLLSDKLISDIIVIIFVIAELTIYGI